MARRRRRRNPTGIETGLLTVLGVVVGGVAAFWVASWACGRIVADVEAGMFGPPGGEA